MRQTGASTGGRLLAFEMTLEPGGHVPASHVHPAQEERFTVSAGRMRFRHGLRTIIASAGETVIVEPGTIHRFANVGPGVARALVEVLLEVTADLAREGRTLPNGMPSPLELALFLREFQHEPRIPILPAGLVRLSTAPLVWAAERRGLAFRYEHSRPLAA
jgi:quercetin dioxygenase-like cupin family protein